MGPEAGVSEWSTLTHRCVPSGILYRKLHSREDGQRVTRVEFRLDCLAADASLENLAQVE